jgi:hypothetical protein
MPGRVSPILPCGKPYGSEEAARTSPRGQRAGAVLEQCRNRACGRWHVRTPAASRPVPGLMAPRRQTGFSYRVRMIVRARAGNGEIDDAVCELCAVWLGRYGGEIQHRAARGAGGCRDAVVNGPANGALLCRDCHRDCEARDEHLGMDGAGFWVRHGTTPEFDPRNAPVMWHARAGSGVLLWLGANGEYLHAQPLAGAA